MKPQETVDYQIKNAWHAISRMYNSAAARHDMTMNVGYVLINVDEREGTPATHIAPKLGLEVRSLTRTLKKMEEDGLIYREGDRADRRMVRIRLTAEGVRRRDIAKETVKQFNWAVRAQINPDRLKAFFEVIGEINRIVDGHPVPAGVV
ncbi:MAG: MarR family transcriptional regulator [Catalinimonas sp.]